MERRYQPDTLALSTCYVFAFIASRIVLPHSFFTANGSLHSFNKVEILFLKIGCINPGAISDKGNSVNLRWCK